MHEKCFIKKNNIDFCDSVFTSFTVFSHECNIPISSACVIIINVAIIIIVNVFQLAGGMNMSFIVENEYGR